MACRVEDVVKGLLMLVEDDSKSGEVMRVTVRRGIDYERYRTSKL